MFPRRVFLSCLVAVTLAGATHAQDLVPANGAVLLTVSGAVPVTNAGDTAQFDGEMLKNMSRVEFTTSTIWTENEQSFVGVPLKEVLEAVGIVDGVVAATAINDYAVEIPVSSLTETAPIIAYEWNGEALSLRKKGPLWVVYPYDSAARFQTEVIYSRSIWQLDRLLAN